jgi:hypothetical protein
MRSWQRPAKRQDRESRRKRRNRRRARARRTEPDLFRLVSTLPRGHAILDAPRRSRRRDDLCVKATFDHMG